MKNTKWRYISKGLVIILSLFVVATIASVVYLSTVLFKTDRLVEQNGNSVSTILEVMDYNTHIDAMDRSAREYATTGGMSALQTFSSLDAQTSDLLKTLNADERAALPRAQKTLLARLGNQHVEVLRNAIAIRQADDPEGGLALLLSNQKNQGLTKLRDLVRGISAANLQDTRQRQVRAQSELRFAIAVAIAVTIFILGICFVLLRYFQNSIQRERAVENTKNEFLSLASHQLRTPATNVKQYVGLLLEGYLGEMTDKQQDALQIAYKNNESEIKIINDLLDVAKLDLKRIQLNKRSVDIVSVVRQVVQNYQSQAADKRQMLTLKAPEALLAEVDRGYFKSVVQKLVDNAIKYSRQDTRIIVKIRLLENKDMFEVVVRDRGVGIQKHEMPRLFRKFSRLTNEFSANSEGSGLGLYWVKEIMDLHGGSVEVVSREGHGSKFIARSPIK